MYKINHSDDLYNIILGGLIALSSEHENGSIKKSSMSDSVFLGKWLKRAKKQKSYSKSVSRDIDAFLLQYKIKGRLSKLGEKFNEIHQELHAIKGMPNAFDKKEKSRFDLVLAKLFIKGWYPSFPLVHNYKIDGPYRPEKEKEIFTTMWYWDGVFNEKGILIKPMSFFVFSSAQEVIDCFYEHGFLLAKSLSSIDDKGKKYYQFKLYPNNGCSGEIAIPTKFIVEQLV